MAWEDTYKTHIEILIDNKEWISAYNSLLAYIDEHSKDYWAKSTLSLVERNKKTP